MIDNAKSHTLFAKDALRVESMGKAVGRVKSFLRDG